MKNNDHIPTSEIEQDIADTQTEIDQYQNELNVLRSNPVENRLQIYLREGKISMRKNFIKRLQEIIKERNLTP